MALTILTGSSQAAAFNYSYTTSGSADWASVPTASYFYDIVDKTVRFKATNSTFSNVATASFALTASNVTGTVTSASYALTASYISNAVSASYALTASYVVTALTASYVTASNVVGTVTSASYALTASNVTGTVVSASYAQTSSLANFALSANTAGTASEANSIATAITNNVDNNILTATGTGTIEGESSLTFDGTTLTAIASFVQGDGSPIATGIGSHAEGVQTEATGDYSHAEGYRATSQGDGSHAEGENTQTYGNYSHTEGYITQTGFDQGYLALINDGTCSLDASYGDVTADYTLGDTLLIDVGGGTYTPIISSINYTAGKTILTTTLSGITIDPVTVGNLTTGAGTWAGGYPIGGAYSHAEGIGTIALGYGQHVSGQYNIIEDATSLFIVGNGIDDGNRSNAFKVTPSGSIVLPNIQPTEPTWDGVNGEMIFSDDGAGTYTMYVWLDGRWRSSSLA
jgi:trimeric autotransporter adhesin